MPLFVRVVLALSTLALSLSCAGPAVIQKMSPEQSPNLTQREAALRAQQVANPRYQLFFSLIQKEIYTGRSRITFDYTPAREDLRIDFNRGEVLRITLNQEPLSLPYNGHYLLLPKKLLKPGSNEVEIEFSHSFSNNGRGFHRFNDPEDGRSYVYTNLEPFEANKVFPCFDQPDLKATYEMSVVAPRDWTVITSVRETGVKDLSPELREWSFPQSAKFSTYIWSLHAGPYHMWEDKSFRYPLRLFVRKSMASFVDIKKWLPITKQGFDFFDSYFGYPYPYKKYDQVIVPEFNSGAMENVAAVTFSERYVPRGEMPRALERRLANVIYHEMAHMWFGNLVTMKWWNDLWLNESFATYMAYLGLQESTAFKESWAAFASNKTWAYWEDSRVTNHPIEGPVRDTLETFANFDGITYGKGASVLKQLSFYLGADKFQNGLKNYFQKYAEKNTVIEDFMGELSKASGKDLSRWKQLWLQTSGTNTLRPRWACVNEKISEFYVDQFPDKSSEILRPHAFEISLLASTKKGLEVTEIFSAEVSGAETALSQALGRACPQAVQINDQDHGFFQVQLDAQTLSAFRRNPSQVQDPLVRQLFWLQLGQMVEQEMVPITEYVDLVMNQALRNESESLIIEMLATPTRGSSTSYPHAFFWDVLSYRRLLLSEQERAALDESLEKVVWGRLRTAKPGSELQKTFFHLFVGVASSSSGLLDLIDLLKGRTRIKSLQIDPDQRWAILSALSAKAHPLANALIDEEKRRDPSSSGKKLAIKAKAAAPNKSVVQGWIQEILREKGDYSFQELRSAAEGMSLHDPFARNSFSVTAAEYIALLTRANDQLTSDNQASLLTQLQPIPCGGEGKEELKAFAQTAEGRLKPALQKPVRQAQQDSEACERFIELACKQMGSTQDQNP